MIEGSWCNKFGFLSEIVEEYLLLKICLLFFLKNSISIIFVYLTTFNRFWLTMYSIRLIWVFFELSIALCIKKKYLFYLLLYNINKCILFCFLLSQRLALRTYSIYFLIEDHFYFQKPFEFFSNFSQSLQPCSIILNPIQLSIEFSYCLFWDSFDIFLLFS